MRAIAMAYGKVLVRVTARVRAASHCRALPRSRAVDRRERSGTHTTGDRGGDRAAQGRAAFGLSSKFQVSTLQVGGMSNLEPADLEPATPSSPLLPPVRIPTSQEDGQCHVGLAMP